MLATPTIALTVAGSDPSGGAGIQADLKTFSALGVYGAAVITSLTAQNTLEVRGIFDASVTCIDQQLDTVFEDLAVAATKIGMLSKPEIIHAVAGRLRAHQARNVVLDPVMVAKSGDKLLRGDSIEALRRELVPLAEVLTPNLPEAAVLLGEKEGEVLVAPEAACRKLVALGCRAVVLKGGHAGGSHSEDLYFDGTEFVRLPARRTITDNTHGTGCTFSSAIAAHLARGFPRLEAVQRAKRYITAAIEGGKDWKIGRGHGPVHHFHELWPASS